MFKTKFIIPATGLAILLGSTATFAEVTAQDVWSDFQENLAVYGDSGVTIGSENTDGNTLTITDLNLRVEDPQSDMLVEAIMSSITFTDQGDGTVLINIAENYPITISGEGTVIQASIRHQGMEIVVSGSPEELLYEVTADRYGFYLDEINDSGETIPVTAVLQMHSVEGAYRVWPGEIREMDYEVSIGTLDIFADYPKQGDANEAFNFSGQIADLNFQAEMAFPEGMSFEDPENVSFEGVSAAGSYTFGPLAYVFSILDRNTTADGTAQATGGSLDFRFNSDAVAYRAATQNMQVSLNSSDLPFPINLSLAEYGLEFAMPLSRTEEPAEFGAAVNITGLSVNEEIWMMADPAGQLPRDPLTAQIGLSGTAKWLFDLLDPAQAEELSRSDMPAELYSLQIDALNIDALGVQITGDGAFTFDNTDLTTFGGMPRPEGSASVSASGVNGLMDTLVNMGLIPQDQIMGARMMMGIFATSTGDDQLSSSLEINAQGHVIANGQRLQ